MSGPTAASRLDTAAPAAAALDRDIDTSNAAIKQRLTWFHVMTSPLRVLPDFLIIGTQKGGTSSLYRYLSEHPQIAASAGKELHYFDRRFSCGPYWYRAHFPTAFYRRRVVKRTGKALLTGEATPYYLFHPYAPERVKALVPGVKLIALLRDPVERAFSSYQHQVRAGEEQLSFAEAIDREHERLAGGGQFEERGSGKARVQRKFSYLARGVYADQLQAWLAVFPREQMLIVRSEDFFEAPEPVFRQVTDFLTLRPWQPRAFPRFNSAEYGQMDAEVRDRLAQYFAVHNQRLYALIGRDFGWLG